MATGSRSFPFKFNLAPIIRARIHKAIAEFKEYTCIKFVPKSPSDEDYVVFKDGKG